MRGGSHCFQVVNITALDESSLIAAVGTEGPVSIAFEVADDVRPRRLPPPPP